MKDSRADKQPYSFQPRQSQSQLDGIDNPKGSVEYIQQQRIAIDLQLELSKLRYELSTYQKHYQDLELELEDWKLREEHYLQENVRFQQQAFILEQDLQQSKKFKEQLKDELKQTQVILEQERQQKMDMLEQIINKEKQTLHLKDEIKKYDSQENQRKQDIKIRTQKNMDEELNRFKNELQYKFEQKEKKYKQIIEQLQGKHSQEQQIQFNQSSQSTKNKWTNQNESNSNSKDQFFSSGKKNQYQFKRLLELTYANNLDESCSYVEKIMKELNSFQQIIQRLSQQLGFQNESDNHSPQQLIILLDHLARYRDKQNIIKSQNQDHNIGKLQQFLTSLKYFLGVEDINEIIPEISAKNMELEGNQRLIGNILLALKIENDDDFNYLENAIYERLGMR